MVKIIDMENKLGVTLIELHNYEDIQYGKIAARETKPDLRPGIPGRMKNGKRKSKKHKR